MKVVSTYHNSTSAISSLKCKLLGDSDLEFLIVAKSSALDVYAIYNDGLRLQCSLDIWGRITSLQSTTEDDSNKATLLITTDHPDPRLLIFAYVSEKDGSDEPHLNCIKSISLHERNARPAEYFNGVTVNPSGQVAVVSSYVGKLKVLELSGGKYQSDFDVAIRELNLLSLCFLPTTNHRNIIVAMLHRDHNQKIVLTSHELFISELEMSSSTSSVLQETTIPDSSAYQLIPVPPHSQESWNPQGGVLVVSAETVYFYSNSKKGKKKSGDPKAKGDKLPSPEPSKAQVHWPYSDVSAWTQVDPEGTRFLLGDEFGRLVLLALSRNVQRLELMFLGDISSPTSLTVLPSNFIFVASHFGDSQLININSIKPTDGTYVQVMEQFKNIAPIMDAVLVDTDGSGQNEIVTCSGGKNTGSIRVIQDGANFTVDAVVEDLQNVVGVWPLRTNTASSCDEFILASTPVSTYGYALPSHNDDFVRLSDDEFPGFVTSERTITAANTKMWVKPQGQSTTYEHSHLVVQVTPTQVRLVSMKTGVCESSWLPDKSARILLADTSPSQVCLALSSGDVVMLLVDGSANRLVKKSEQRMTRRVSALSLVQSSTKDFASLVLLGFWDNHEVQTFKLPHFERVGKAVAMSSLPRSLLVFQFGLGTPRVHTHILVGQGDGTVFTAPFNKGDIDEVAKKVFMLGESPVHLTKALVDGKSTVLAGGSRTALFSWKKDGVHYTPVLLKDTIASCPLNSSDFLSSLVLVSTAGMSIGRILELDKLHIRTITMGFNNPVRIAYHPMSRTFGVGCVKTEPNPVSSGDEIESSVVIVDATSYTVTRGYALNTNEELTALSTVSLSSSCDLEEAYFAAGSMYYDANEREPTRGRLLIFSAESRVMSRSGFMQRMPHMVADAEVQGCVYSIANIKGKVVAAVNAGIVLFGLSETTRNEISLVKLYEWNHNYIVTSIAVNDDKIVLGDAVSSISVLELEGDRVKTLARDYGPLWPLCLDFVEGTSIIGANTDNVFSFKLQSLAEKVILDQDGEFRVDETINKFTSGHLNSEEIARSAKLKPKHVFFTSSGRIGVVIETVDESTSMNLTHLLRNLAYVIQGPGNVSYSDWHSPVSTRGRSDGHPIQGFVDGDFLERFLDFAPSSDELTRTMKGSSPAEKLNMSYQEIRSMLETLRSLH